MIKITPILAALAALPLLAQEPQATENETGTVKCTRCGNPMEAQCPQAAVAAALGFQKGFHMGFETGFAEAARLMKGGCPGGGACRSGKERPRCGPQGKGGQPKPMPRPEPAPAPTDADE